uniref:Acyl-CoA-binding domain-containing protein 6 n=1 Tax=Anopheles atroparvus TaxID=41427 RepID=A0AAG5DTI9_ANOAO
MLELEDDDPIDVSNDRSFYEATTFLEQNTNLFEQQQLLQFYGLYKQATVGPCNIPKPGIFNVQARAKWFAWSGLKEQNQESAKKSYVQLMSKLQPGWNEAQHNAPSSSWVSVSRPKREVENSDGLNSLLDFVKEGNAQEAKKVIESGKNNQQLNILDDEGLGVIHWAADRGNADILQCLLNSVGIDVNLQDCEGQTALHYASSCGNMECIQILLSHNADRSITDKNG